ncbi:sugar phosphate isomerase/epimerase family protein [Brevibacillus parabrevis]|uniref:sugar phosphate isomerase/epimerase family protein n=1 Tax=Brevibacillus parabrevis TaxID=54914 RepID=UPI00113F0743|nr:sugar phosphate isomerase/epimerase family protein [Brevibacillus parabrevis]TGV18184.1 sugar phosphate isomerase/epimerase [Mesorhizobium sp. M00.F.Ca.ET.186.01.1.1]
MLYVSSTLMWSYPVEAAILIARQYGFAGMEVWAEHVWFHKSNPREIQQAAKRVGMKLTLHAASWDLNLCSLNSGIRKQSVEEIKRSLALAGEIGAKSVTIHPGRVTLTHKNREWHEAVLIESLNELAQEAVRLGRVLSIEHIEPLPKELIVTPGDLNRLRAALNYPTAATLDIAHVPLTCSLPQFLGELEGVDKIHVSDATATKLHMPLGTGDIDLPTIWPLLLAEEKPLVVEGFDDARNLSQLKQNLLFLQQGHSVSFG